MGRFSRFFTKSTVNRLRIDDCVIFFGHIFEERCPDSKSVVKSATFSTEPEIWENSTLIWDWPEFPRQALTVYSADMSSYYRLLSWYFRDLSYSWELEFKSYFLWRDWPPFQFCPIVVRDILSGKASKVGCPKKSFLKIFWKKISKKKNGRSCNFKNKHILSGDRRDKSWTNTRWNYSPSYPLPEYSYLRR